MKCKILLPVAAICLLSAYQEPDDITFRDSASYRWLNKEVLESRTLDDMETLDHWVPFTTGAPEVVDARVVSKVTEATNIVARLALTREHSHDGGQSLRMRIPAGLDAPGPKSGRSWGSTGVRRQFSREDWTAFNRVSVWIYPNCPGFQVVYMELRIYNDGVEKLPALFGQEGENSLILRNHEWNHVVWEVGNVARDKVTNLEFSCLLSGHEPEGSDSLQYDFDGLTLEKVEPDYIEGWDVWPGRISYSHAGYQNGAVKTAIASNIDAKEFRLISQETGETVLKKTIQIVNAHLGVFQVMDFTEITQTGSYILKAGPVSSQPFRIDPDTWRETILKALNFFRVERCGAEVPGVHGICHRDWTVIHRDKRIVINGGWHDAGDLTQGLGNTAEAVYGMFSLAERLRSRDEDTMLYNMLMEEGLWGLDWLLKTRFGDGYRNEGAISSRWTNGIIGDYDDLTSKARNSPLANFTACASEAIACRVLRDRDPRLAAYSLKIAEEDWRFAVGALTGDSREPGSLWTGAFDSDNVEHDVASVGILASVDLWRVTGKQEYADKAAGMAGIILESQANERPDWDVPVYGFFYTGPEKDHILHYCHRGRSQGPILALVQLCDAFPGHPDWMKWYSAVAMYADYLKTIAEYTSPYGVFPASVYKNDEYISVPESRRESFRLQVLQGIHLGKGYYLRLFPVWMDYRGHFGTILPQAQALANAARLRGDPAAATLAQHQLEWIIGRNPFSQSTMWGVGYDYTPLYAPFPGDIAGALPVGIQTRGERDVPYWPVQNTWTYKEVWSHPTSRWIWLMRDLAGPALVEGKAIGTVVFRETSTGRSYTVESDPETRQFSAWLPEGTYRLHGSEGDLTRSFLPTGRYYLDLGKDLDYGVSGSTTPKGDVTIRLEATGTGNHRFELRNDNLTITGSPKEIALAPGKTGILEWHGRVISKRSPWFAVIVPDGDLAARKEATGSVWNE